MAINLFRHDPSKWIPAIEEAYKHSPELKKAINKKAFVKIVKETTKKPPVSFDEVANNACRENNKILIAKAEA